MKFNEKLQAITAQLASDSPQASEAVEEFIRELSQSDITQYVLKEGDRIPEFCLESTTGEMVSIKALHTQNPLIITFYRGGWCPYCNMELLAWQSVYDQVLDCGFELVGISPERIEALSVERSTNTLTFKLLWDNSNNFAKLCGLVFKLSPEMDEFMANFGVDLLAINGSDSKELPIPATYVIGIDGIIQHAFFDVDYRIRKDPEEILRLISARSTIS